MNGSPKPPDVVDRLSRCACGHWSGQACFTGRIASTGFVRRALIYSVAERGGGALFVAATATCSETHFVLNPISGLEPELI
jgi:hypothetical protein